MRHPNIIQFLACVFEPYVCLVLELAAYGCLRALLFSKDFTFKWDKRCASMMRGVARAVNYLHSLSPPLLQ